MKQYIFNNEIIFTDSLENLNNYKLYDLIQHPSINIIKISSNVYNRILDAIYNLLSFKYFKETKYYNKEYIEELIFNFEYYNIITLEFVLLCATTYFTLNGYEYFIDLFWDTFNLNLDEEYNNLYKLNLSVFDFSVSVIKFIKNNINLNNIKTIKNITYSFDDNILTVEHIHEIFKNSTPCIFKKDIIKNGILNEI